MEDTEKLENPPQFENETSPREEIKDAALSDLSQDEDGPKPSPGVTPPVEEEAEAPSEGVTASGEGVPETEGSSKEGKGEEAALPPMETRPPATCKYRWARTVPTRSTEVIFFSSHKPNEPVVLSWNDAQEVYYSPEMQVASGDYRGSVVVEGSTYPVEEHNVRPYTFEVDLYIKDDIIEDEVRANGVQLAEERFKETQQARPIDTYRDINTDLAGLPNMENSEGGIHLSSKYEELIRQQLQSKDNLDTSIDSEVTLTQKIELSSSLNGSVRHTPIGDIAVEPYRDDDNKALSNHSNAGSLNGSVQGSTHGSVHGSTHGSVHGSTHGSVHGSTHGSVHGSTHGSVHGSTHGSARESPHYDLADGGRSSILDGLDMESLRSHHSSARQTPQSNTIEDVLSSSYPRPSSRQGSELSGSLHGSTRQTPTSDVNGGVNSGSQSLDGSLRHSTTDLTNRPSSAQGSLHGSTSHMPVTEAVDDILEKYGRLSNRDKSESIEDVLETPPRSIHSSVRTTPQKELMKEDLSLPGSQRQTPQKDAITDSLRSSRERLYGSQELARTFEGSSRPGSHEGSNRSGSYEGSNRPASAGASQRSGSSRPQSVTSEQELSQYLELQRGELGPRRAASLTGLHHSDPLLPPISQDRTGSAASMPPMGLDRHLSTPDNHIRVPPGAGSPQIRSPLITGRSGSAASRTSNRTITPTSGTAAPVENGFREDRHKLQDYEDMIVNLRKLLAGREAEVHQLTDQVRDLKDINRSLQEELEHGRAGSGRNSRSSNRDYEHLKNEKEILAAEVVKLQDQLSAYSGRNADSISIDVYSPNNPLALQRKIADLEGHMQDMQEANETTMSHLTGAEKQVKELMQENEKLRSRQAHSLQDLEADNRRLHEKISLLGEGGSSDYRLRIEIQQLKDDLRSLRDRNYSLNEENIRLKEGQESKPASQELAYSYERKSTRETSKTDDRPRRITSKQTTPDHSPLTQKNISTLERNYLMDRESKYALSHRLDASYLDNYRVERHSIPSQERSRSDAGQDRSRSNSGQERLRTDAVQERSRSDRGRLHRSDRSMPDGQDKLVTDSNKYSRRSWERSRSERDLLARDMTLRDVYSSDRSKEMERREDKYERHRTSSSQLDSRGFLEGQYKRSGYSSDLGDIASGSLSLRSRDFESSSRKRHSSYDRAVTSYDREIKDYDIPRKTYTEENGEISDTATDILLSSDIIDRKPSRSHRRRRRQSVESVDSVSSLSDEDQSGSRRRRSKSVDARGDWSGRRTPSGSPARTTPASQMRVSASTERLSQVAPGSAGFRSVTPTPLTTQHNKGMLGSPISLSSSLTQGMRPFAPRSPADMKPEDVVKFSRQGGKLSQGMVKFIGHLPGRGDVYLGVELDKEEGKHDGTFEGIRYFKCKPNKGVFVAFNKVVMAWAP